MKSSFKIFWQIILATFLISCKSINKPYDYKRFPDSYSEIKQEYNGYYHFADCKPGETIASIGAGNGMKEIQISCFNQGISWYLQEIDSSKLYEFNDVLQYHESVKGSSIDADFNLVLGTERSTALPHEIFDRILMLNVFHEVESREGIMMEIHELLNENGVLVIMERMGDHEGEVHGDCKYPKLVEDGFLREMNRYGYTLNKKRLGEEMSNLMFYSFASER